MDPSKTDTPNYVAVAYASESPHKNDTNIYISLSLYLYIYLSLSLSIYIYIYDMYVYTYIYIYIYIGVLRNRSQWTTGLLGAKYCTPEINTSEIIVDFQSRFPMDFHLSLVCSKGLSLFQWISSGLFQRTFSGIFKQNCTVATSGAYSLAPGTTSCPSSGGERGGPNIL